MFKETEEKNVKHIFFFIDSLSGGGAERVVSIVSGELANRGFQVSIVMLQKRKIAYEIHDDVQLIYAEDLEVCSKKNRMIVRFFRVYEKIFKKIYKPVCAKFHPTKEPVHLVDTSFYLNTTYALAYKELLEHYNGSIAFGFLIKSNICMLQACRGLKSIKAVYCERNNPARPDIPGVLLKTRDRVFGYADVAVFQTEEQISYYKHRCPLNYVIPNPINEKLPRPYIGARKNEIVTFCRVEPQKNLDLLINAFQKIKNDFPEYILRIYGNGWYTEELRRHIEIKGLNEAVYIHPFASNVHDLILKSAMFVSTSDFEGISNSMLEAMALGLPCVCTDCDGGGARMMIRDHENGLLVPKGDTDAVYCAMKEIIENPDLAKKLSEEAYKIRYELSTDKIVEKWMEVIR